MSLFTFTNTIPASTHAPSQDQPLMLQNNQSTQGIIGIDHVGFNTATTGGYHNKSSYVIQSGDPAAVPGGVGAGADIVYSKLSTNSTDELFVRKQGGVIQELTIIKAWCVFNLGGAFPITPIDGYNVTSITNPGPNLIQINFTNNVANANYGVLGTVADNPSSRTTSSFQISIALPSALTGITIMVLQS
jgi:hypothetical protein